MSTHPRCFVPGGVVEGALVELSADDVRHLTRVLRLEPGNGVTVFDGKGVMADGVLERGSGGRWQARILRAERAAAPRTRVTLVQSLLKNEPMDLVIQKATELGAVRVVPLMAERVVVQLDAKRAPGRLERWRKIAVAAAAQCGSPWIPEIAGLCDLPEALATVREAPDDLMVFGSLQPGALPLSAVLRQRADGKPRGVAALIGPEGDFSPAEHAAMIEAGCVPVTLGPRVLRAETAALFVLSAVLYEWGL